MRLFQLKGVKYISNIMMFSNKQKIECNIQAAFERILGFKSATKDIQYLFLANGKSPFESKGCHEEHAIQTNQ